MEGSLAVPYKTKHTSIHTIQPSNCTAWCLPKGTENFYPHKNLHTGTSLVAQWLRIHLPMQGTRVWSLVQEDPTCRGATEPVCHNYWACALEPASHNYWAHAPRAHMPQLLSPRSRAHTPQLLKPTCLKPVLCNKRSHCNEKPTHRNEE